MTRRNMLITGMLMLMTSAPAQVNDSNTPLHLLQPAYRYGYGTVTVDDVKKVMDRVFDYVDAGTPARVVDRETGVPVTNYKKINENSQLERGTFRLTSYEWGVTYSAMLAASDATGDPKYADYTYNRVQFLADVSPYFKKALEKGGKADDLIRKVLNPGALDDAGAICCAMIKASCQNPKLKVEPLIENYMDFILNKEYRLADGTFGRIRPQYNTVWLDDMFMGIPPIAYYSLVKKDGAKYLDEAVKQIRQFKQRMWVPEKKLFRHGWVESMSDHPAFHWGRANGWAILTMCEVLDILPEQHPGRNEILSLLKEHVQGLCALQSGDGLWHQLLDRNDSYLETSATAIYAYCIAHAINKGWIDAKAYGPVAVLAWHGVASQVNEKGQVENVCVGTGMGFDPSFYYYRPVNVSAAHGYGPVIWAGAELIRLLKSQYPKMNDSAVQFYDEDPKTDRPIFGVSKGEKGTSSVEW